MVRPARTAAETEEFNQKIQAALHGLETGLYKTPNAAAMALDLNHKTVRDCWTGRRTDDHSAKDPQRLLTKAQSDALESWCIHLSWTGEPLSRASIKPYVKALCGSTPSGSWVERYLRDNPHLVFRRPTGLDPKRAQAFNRTEVKRHFHRVRSIVQQHNIPLENQYNMDEKGIPSGGGRRGTSEKFICGNRQRVSTKLRSSNLELTTATECVSGDGYALKPGFILSGAPGHMQEQWFDVEGVGSVALSENGWTDDELTYLWFKKVFVPQAEVRNKTGQPILLMMDGHGSHASDQIREYGYSRTPRVHLYLFPPHTTHRLQPLDVGVFGVAQRHWSKLCDDRVAEGNPVTRETVIREWMSIRPLFMQPDIIMSAWEKTGLNPSNPNIFTDEDFAPSLVSSTQSNRPNDYPDIDLEYETDEDESGCEHSHGQGVQAVPAPNQPGQTAGGRISSPDAALDITPANNIPPLTRSDLRPPTGLDVNSLEELCREMSRLRIVAERAITNAERSEERAAHATAHASIMAHKNAELQNKINNSNPNKKKKNVNTHARFLTGDEEMAIRRQEIAEEKRQAEEAQARSLKLQRDAAQRQAARMTNASSITWKVGWRRKNKEDLRDLAFVLGQSLDGTKQQLIDRIDTYLLAHPSLARDPRFLALYPGSDGTQGVGEADPGLALPKPVANN